MNKVSQSDKATIENTEIKLDCKSDLNIEAPLKSITYTKIEEPHSSMVKEMMDKKMKGEITQTQFHAFLDEISPLMTTYESDFTGARIIR